MDLFEELKRFASLQVHLVSDWRAACADSHDLDLLLDFPKRTMVESRGSSWVAIKHGAGVRFESESMVVDVPHGIERPDWFDSDRFYDYLRSRGMLELIAPSSERNRRKLLFDLFEDWVAMGRLSCQQDELGRSLFALEPHEGT